MDNLINILKDFEKCLKNIDAPVIKTFHNGLDFDQIDSLLPIRNTKLQALYSWKNGVKEDGELIIGKFDFFSFGYLRPLHVVIQSISDLIKHTSIDNLLLLPIITNGSGDYILYDSDMSSNTFDRLLIYAPSLTLSPTPVPIYESLENCFTSIIECYSKEIYKYNSKGFLEIDYELEQIISAKHNPSIDYWFQ